MVLIIIICRVPSKMNKLLNGLIEVYFITNNTCNKVLEVDNMITVGLGYSIANLMTSVENENSDNFTVSYSTFGFGNASTSPTPTASSYIFELANPVNIRFLNNNISADIEELLYLKGTTYITSSEIASSDVKFPFITIPQSRITATSNNAVKHTILLDDSFDQEYDIKELGLFIKNPNLSFIADTPIMAAYKSFDTPINKPSGVKLKIDWTFRFNI